jgi:hypothetical protein
MRYLQPFHADVLHQRQLRFGQVNAERGNGPICALSIPRTNLPDYRSTCSRSHSEIH